MGEAHGVEIYTDGACSPNPGPGGWGVVLRFGVHERELYGSDPGPTTNNRMELMAAIRGLEALKRRSEVQLFTDSTYVRNGVLSWVAKWKRNGWLTSGKEPVKNEDLWRRLDAATGRHDVEWHWVKGHAGHPDNERADKLAVRGAKEAAKMPPKAPEPEQVPAQMLFGVTASDDAVTRQEKPAVTATQVRIRPDEDDCVHEMPASWCALCKPRPAGVLARGYFTSGGAAYHNDPHCIWLRKGQRNALHQGRQVHEITPIAWDAVAPGQLELCEYCCTVDWVRKHR